MTDSNVPAELVTAFQNATAALRALADQADATPHGNEKAGQLVARATWVVASERKLTTAGGSQVTSLLGCTGTRTGVTATERAATV